MARLTRVQSGQTCDRRPIGLGASKLLSSSRATLRVLAIRRKYRLSVAIKEQAGSCKSSKVT